MRVWVVYEDGAFNGKVIGVYLDRIKAIEKQMECSLYRSITECILE